VPNFSLLVANSCSPAYRNISLLATIAIFAAVVMQSSHAALVLIITAFAAVCSGRGRHRWPRQLIGFLDAFD